MYTNNIGSNYKGDSPKDYARNTSYSVVGYSDSSMKDSYSSLISESKCRCKGTCRTGIGCTCK